MNTEYKSLTLLSSKQEVTTTGNLATAIPFNYYSVYSIKLPAFVKAGTILDIDAQAEITVAKNYIWSLGYGCVISSSSTDVSTPLQNKIRPNIGYTMFNGGGTSVHAVANYSTKYYVSDDLTNKYLNFFVYVYSSSAVGGDTATFGNGQLDCLIYH